MKSKAVILLLLSMSSLAIEPKFMKDPAVSPDGETVCFSYKKDLWSVPFNGGNAKRLTSVRGNESNPSYSPDGKSIAFNSDRDGYGSIYYIPSDGGNAKKVISGNYFLIGWFADSNELLLSENKPYLGTKLYRVKLDGSNLKDMNAVGYPYGDLSKDNDSFVFCYYGDPYRERMKGSTRGSLHVYNMNKDTYSTIYDSEYTDRYPVYSKTNGGIYFARSDGKCFQICFMPKEEIGKKEPEVEQLTDFTLWSARDISIARYKDRMVYEHFDELWKFDPVLKKSEKLRIILKEDIFAPDKIFDLSASSTDRYYPSPKGNWVLFKYKYDLFAVPYKGGEVKRLTHDSEGIVDFVILEDNETVYFSSLIKGMPRLYKMNIRSEKPKEKIEWSNDKSIEWLKCDKDRLLIFYSSGKYNNTRLAIKNDKEDSFDEIETKKNVIDAIVSKSGSNIMYSVFKDESYTTDLILYNTAKKTKDIIYSDVNWTHNFVLGPDEEFILYNKNGDVFRSDLEDIGDFHFEEDKWKKIFDTDKEEKDSEQENKKAASILEPKNIKDSEVKLISHPGSNHIVHINDKKEIYYINDFVNKKTLRKTDLRFENDEAVKLFEGENISDFNFCDSTATLFYLQSNKIKAFGINSKKIENTNFNISYEYSLQKIYSKVFFEIHAAFKRFFYDAEMHGRDWDRIGELFSEFLDIYHNEESFSAIINEMVGELNSSHTGYYPRSEPEVERLSRARIGVEFDLHDRLDNGIRIKKVFENSVLKTVYGVEKGDILMSVDGENINPGTDIFLLFLNKQNEKITLGIRSEKNKLKFCELKGLKSDYSLRYDTWVSERKKMVKDMSKGRVGYVHIQGMSHGPLQNFIDELFTENFDKEALIIDVRYNGGGYTHDDLIEILTKKQYAYSRVRRNEGKMIKSPNRIWDKPSSVIINRSSFSDAEIFPAIYRELDLGKIIGTPTSGGVIGTGSHKLIDSSSMRMPFVGWFRKDGVNMEGNGVKPDIYVDPTFEQLISDYDPELRKAVEVMLEELES
ncbi:MAG: S41 family peptidase [Candidatus Delongbacteria bacterium]